MNPYILFETAPELQIENMKGLNQDLALGIPNSAFAGMEGVIPAPPEIGLRVLIPFLDGVGDLCGYERTLLVFGGLANKLFGGSLNDVFFCAETKHKQRQLEQTLLPKQYLRWAVFSTNCPSGHDLRNPFIPLGILAVHAMHPAYAKHVLDARWVYTDVYGLNLVDPNQLDNYWCDDFVIGGAVAYFVAQPGDRRLSDSAGPCFIWV